MQKSGVLGALLLSMLLVGCAGATTGGATAGSSADTATEPLATSTPTAQPTIPTADVKRVCGQFMPTPAVVVGALVVAQQTGFGNLAYPARKLADNAARTPFVVQQGLPSDPAHPTNPVMHEETGGYVLTVCNMSSTAHTIKRVDVRIESIVPYTEQLNVWAPCTASYSRNFGVGEQGCGGADVQDEYLHAPFTAAATTGAAVTATQTGTSGDRGYGPLPVTLNPGRVMTIEVGMGSTDGAGYQVFSTAGTYTFAFGLGIDDDAPAFAAISPPTLLAPPAHEWNGAACLQPAMQAQIPSATTPPTFYICPEA